MTDECGCRLHRLRRGLLAEDFDEEQVDRALDGLVLDRCDVAAPIEIRCLTCGAEVDRMVLSIPPDRDFRAKGKVVELRYRPCGCRVRREVDPTLARP